MPDEVSTEDSDSPSSGLSLDSFNVDGATWSEHEVALDGWRQGDVVPRVPLTWMAPAGGDPFTGSEGSAVAQAVDVDGVSDVIIVSQTCDIGATKIGGKHPHVMVAPLIYEADIVRTQDRTDAAKGKVAYLFPVPSDDGEQRYADLRFLMPLSKAFLLGKHPVASLSEADTVGLSETLAHKFRRAAASDAISEGLPRAIDRFVKRHATKAWVIATEQVRLSILEGTRLKPTQVQLLVVTKVKLDDEEQKAWMQVHQQVANALAQDGIKCAKPLIREVTLLDAKTYRESIPIRSSQLGHRQWP